MLEKNVTLFVLFFLLIFLPTSAKQSASLTINILSRSLYNQAGKEMDILVLKEELEKLGHKVKLFDYLKDKEVSQADINIFLAQFKLDYFSKAKQNWLLANPDFCFASVQELQELDLILCKTRECLRIFEPLCKKVYYLGFMSLDCYLPSVSKQFSEYVHIAGKSVMKGTEQVLKVWENHPEFPKLVLIKRKVEMTSIPKNIHLITQRLPRKTLLEIQNQSGIHLCPSKTEGFGHYIMEAMSAGAVVVTTDAPPMNEFIKDPRCLVRYSHTMSQNYATTYIVDEIALATTIQALQKLSYEEMQRIGNFNRKEYLRRKIEFKQNFEQLMHQTVRNLPR